MTINIIGAGNVAQLLGKSFYNAGHQILQVYNRSYRRAKSLAKDLSALAIKDINALNTEADIILIAVSDDAIENIAKRLSRLEITNSIVVHTSGSVAMTTLANLKHHGVFYPFQTMTAEEKLEFQHVPIIISGNIKAVEEKLNQLAESISSKVYPLSDHQRKVIHIAGVFANNFANHMFVLAGDILESEKIPFRIIQPLIDQTVSKLKSMTPTEGQTGPAVREDLKTILSHLEWLKSKEDYSEIYKLLTKSIIDRNSLDASSKFRVKRVD